MDYWSSHKISVCELMSHFIKWQLCERIWSGVFSPKGLGPLCVQQTFCSSVFLCGISTSSHSSLKLRPTQSSRVTQPPHHSVPALISVCPTVSVCLRGEEVHFTYNKTKYSDAVMTYLCRPTQKLAWQGVPWSKEMGLLDFGTSVGFLLTVCQHLLSLCCGLISCI